MLLSILFKKILGGIVKIKGNSSQLSEIVSESKLTL